MAERQTSIDADFTKLKLGLKTQISLIGAVIVVTAWTVTTYASVATKQNLIDALAQRPEHPKTDHRLEKLENKSSVNSREIAVIKQAVLKLDRVDAKIDFLTQQVVLEASESPSSKRRMQKAAQRVRKSAKAAGMRSDPLQDVEGL